VEGGHHSAEKEAPPQIRREPEEGGNSLTHEQSREESALGDLLRITEKTEQHPGRQRKSLRDGAPS